MNTKTYALLWSKKSNCFHIELLSATVNNGMRFFVGNKTNDYLLIQTGAYKEVQDKADELRQTITERETVRRLYEAE